MEQLLTFSEAGQSLPRPVSVHTVRSWASVGVRGVRLRVSRQAGRLYVSRAELAAFLAAVERAAGKTAERVRRSVRRPDRQARAELRATHGI